MVRHITHRMRMRNKLPYLYGSRMTHLFKGILARVTTPLAPIEASEKTVAALLRQLSRIRLRGFLPRLSGLGILPKMQQSQMQPPILLGQVIFVD